MRLIATDGVAWSALLVDTYPFAFSIVDSSGPKDAQAQSYSPGGANVPLWKDTLPSPVE